MLKISEQMTKNIFKITLPTPYLVGPVNTYLMKDEALTLIDVGPKTVEAFNVLKEALKSYKYTLRDIEVVILTHHHPDHVGLLEEFLPYAKVYAHPKCEPWLKQDEAFLNKTTDYFKELYKKNGMSLSLIDKIEKQNQKYLDFSAKAKVDLFVEEGKELPGLRKWSVIDTPGHAQSHISLYREVDGLMISGDHLINHISSNAIIEAPYEGEEDRVKTLLQYRQSLEKCLHVNKAFSGHGDTVHNPKELILKRLNEQENKAEQFKQLLGDEVLTAYELCKRKYPHVYKKQPELTFSETLGHLDLLEENQEIVKVMKEGIIYYKAV